MIKKRAVVTQKQIAEQAGVSQTVVSLVLSGSEAVALSDETRERVLKVAAALGYVPQAAARSLVQGHSNNIGLALIRPHHQVFRDPYIPNVITGLVEVLRARGYRLLVEHIDDLDNVDMIANLLKGGEVAGIVASGHSIVQAILTPLFEVGYPLVMLDETSDAPYSLKINHTAGVRAAARHLIDLGHRQVGCIYYAPKGDYFNTRLNAFLAVFEERNIPFDSRYIRYGAYDPDSGYEAMRSLLDEVPRPTAVFGMNDMMALGAMRAILDAGLRVPDDIAVVGYDDMRFAAFTNPALTTIRAPEVEQGRAAAHMLLKLIEGQPLHVPHDALQPELIIRASCGGQPAS